MNGKALLPVAALALAACALLWTRAGQTRTPRPENVRESPVDAESVGGVGFAPVEGVRTPGEARTPLAAGPLVDGVSVEKALDRGEHYLRVILEGDLGEDVPMASVTVTATAAEGTRGEDKTRDSWSMAGRAGEFPVGPLLELVSGTGRAPGAEELVVKVDHPWHFSETVRIPLSSGEPLANGRTVYEARVHLKDVPYWPEFQIAVRDAATREHLVGVELRCIVTAFMGITGRPGDGYPYTRIGEDLESPIGLMGAPKAGGQEDHGAGIAIRPGAGTSPTLAEFAMPVENARGVIVFARAPGYAWGRLVVDVSKSGERELLLVRSGSLGVRLTNVQKEGYAAVGKQATLFVKRKGPGGDLEEVWRQPIDSTLELEGELLEGLLPGDYLVSVELGGALPMRKRHVLASEEVSLGVAEVRELVLALTDAPSPPERANFGGTLSFPAFGGEENVRLQLYMADYRYGSADYEVSLADMERVGGALPCWSFHLKDLPVGWYQVQLLPFMKNWMVELPAGGLGNLDLSIPELAEVVVETVDARTGERIPLEEIRYGQLGALPGQVHHDWSSAVRTTTRFEGEPGRFRFRMAPGRSYLQTWNIPKGVDIGGRRQELVLIPGPQSVRFELSPPCAIHFEFRVDGAALPREDAIFVGLGRSIHPVDHDGEAAKVAYEVVRVSEPGIYELTFKGVGADRFLPIQPRRVHVNEGETSRVVIDLRRR